MSSTEPPGSESSSGTGPSKTSPSDRDNVRWLVWGGLGVVIVIVVIVLLLA